MTKKNKPVTIIIADDDDDDFFLTERALKKLNISNNSIRVKNGIELVDYLNEKGADPERSYLVLLDLNMPIMDGREALEKIKSNPKFSDVIIVILTTSQEEEDKVSSYHFGANSYIRKPVKHNDFIETISLLNRFWVELVDPS